MPAGQESSMLTEEEKKKRRGNIRAEFDKIVHLTPTLSELENRSELIILNKSADYIEHLQEENAMLVELCQKQGIPVPAEAIKRGPGNRSK